MFGQTVGEEKKGGRENVCESTKETERVRDNIRCKTL